MPGLDEDPSEAIELCKAAHGRLLKTVATVRQEQVGAPSRLPGWTIGHVLTHLARNADGHTRRLEGALRGEDLARYPGGSVQREADISEGAARLPGELLEDTRLAQLRLELAWDKSVSANWPHPEFRGNDRWPSTASPVRRLREVEVHHVDLGLGYEPSDWPEAYVAWELPMLLASVPERMKSLEDSIDLVVWLAGRGPVPTDIQLGPW
ncbi:MAG TPA: maleylpyruvate isomerase family mycothiol-dependent enzyme [Acidimicrobiales bacterium]|nr:maleylpyruvate isomerase family mycothiol-dependent enzyme [Acidimicrobiales bacterium]